MIKCQMKDLHSTPGGKTTRVPAVTVVRYRAASGGEHVPSCQNCSDWAHSEDSTSVWRKNGSLDA